MTKKQVLLFDFLAASIPYGCVGVDTDGRIRDYSKVSDLLNDSKKGNVLRADIDATHSGTIVNHRVYPGTRMRASAKTWLKPYPRPVTDGHPAPLGRMIGNEPTTIGRVRSQKYHQTCSDEQLNEDWKNPGVRDHGSGFIRLGTDITHDDSIEQILSKRMLTVSSGQRISAMVCSVCNKDWLQGGSCEHVPGQTYDVEVETTEDAKGKKTRKVRCFHITGDLEYDHVAMVMTPAQPYARVINSVLGDSDGYEVKLPFHDYYDDSPDRATITGLVLTDRDGGSPIILGDSPESLEIMSRHTKSTASVPTYSAVDGKPPAPTSSNEDGDMTRKLTDAELAERNILATILIDAKIDMDWDAMDETKDDLDKLAHDLDAEDYELSDDQLNILFDGEVPDDVKEDKRLTTAARKKLKSSTFCGPNRSFPVPDCSHAANAKARLPNAKLSSAQKKSVLSCVNRKAKAMGCFKKNADNESEIDATVKTEPGAHLKGEAPESKDAEAPKDNDPKDMSKEDLIAKIAVLKEGLKDKSKECAALLEENVLLLERLRVSLAKQIHSIRSISGRPNVPCPTDEDAVKAYVDSLASKSIEYLDDALSDLLSEVSVSDILRGSVADPTLSNTENDENKGTEPKKPAKNRSPIQTLEDKMSG